VRRLLAAIDESAAARAVLVVARGLAPMYRARVDVLHVAEGAEAAAAAAAAAAGLGLRVLEGPVLDVLRDAVAEPGVAGLVLGARGTPEGRRPVGSTALALITSARRPLVVVPPDVGEPFSPDRILVPLNGTLASAGALAETVELACRCQAEVVLLHVHHEALMPAFSDQPQHEVPAFAREFLRRYCPRSLDDVRLELRIGDPREHVLAVAAETGADLVALGWSQQLGEGRAAVVRETLASSPIPILLVPVGHLSERHHTPKEVEFG
jgi:nucleotide-binding universal stress UspA family protein